MAIAEVDGRFRAQGMERGISVLEEKKSSEMAEACIIIDDKYGAGLVRAPLFR